MIDFKEILKKPHLKTLDLTSKKSPYYKIFKKTKIRSYNGVVKRRLLSDFLGGEKFDVILDEKGSYSLGILYKNHLYRGGFYILTKPSDKILQALESNKFSGHLGKEESNYIIKNSEFKSVEISERIFKKKWKPIIAIITYDRINFLKKCVEHIKKYTDDSVPIIVCDDGSKDGTKQWCQKESIEIIQGNNKGVVWNKNRGLYYVKHYTDCDPVILIEDDFYPIGEWLDAWVKAVEIWDHINVVYPVWTRKGIYDKGEGTPENPYRSTHFGGGCIGTSMRSLDIGGFLDVDFKGYGYGHVEWTKRLGKLGFKSGFPLQYAIGSNIYSHVHDHVNYKTWAKTTYRKEHQLIANKFILKDKEKRGLGRKFVLPKNIIREIEEELTKTNSFSLFTSVDDNEDFILSAIKLIESIKKYPKTYNNFKSFVCLYEQLTQFSIDILQKYGWTLKKIDNLPEFKRYGTVPVNSTWYRYLIPQICDDDYALYLDADMFFIDDAFEIFNWPILLKNYNKSTGACIQSDNGTAYNAGLLMMNLNKWRKKKYSNMIFNCGKQISKMISNSYLPSDQTALNKVIKSDVFEINQKYNITPGFWSKPEGKIIHFRGPKPWNDDCFHNTPYVEGMYDYYKSIWLNMKL